MLQSLAPSTLRHVANTNSRTSSILTKLAHNEILDYDPSETVQECKNVADFFKGTTDPKLESAVLGCTGRCEAVE